MKVEEYADLAREEGVNVLVDRTDLDADEIPDGHEDGHWVGPFVYEADPDADLRCTHEEVFGPHVALLEYDGDIERAVEIHNDTEYGLAGAIVSEDYREINYYRDYAEVGLAYGNPCIGAEVPLRRREEVGQGLSERPRGHRGRHRADRLDAQQLQGHPDGTGPLRRHQDRRGLTSPFRRLVVRSGARCRASRRSRERSEREPARAKLSPGATKPREVFVNGVNEGLSELALTVDEQRRPRERSSLVISKIEDFRRQRSEQRSRLGRYEVLCGAVPGGLKGRGFVVAPATQALEGAKRLKRTASGGVTSVPRAFNACCRLLSGPSVERQFRARMQLSGGQTVPLERGKREETGRGRGGGPRMTCPDRCRGRSTWPGRARL